MDTSALEGLLASNSVTKSDFITGFKSLQNSGNYGDDSIFASAKSDEDVENIFKSFDANGDGQIDKLDKITDKTLSEETISEDDLNLLVEELNNLLSAAQMQANPFASGSANSAAASSGGGGGGGGGYDGAGTEPQNPVDNSGNKDYSSMSKEELEKELETANNTLETNQKAKNDIINGSNSELSDLQKDTDEKEQAYQKQLNEVAPELASKYQEAKGALDEHNQQIANTQVSINEKQASIDSLNASISDLGKQISSYDSAISNLEAKEGANDAPEDLSARISELKQKREEAKEQLNAKNEQLQQEESELEQLKTTLSELEALTAEKEQALQTIQAEIDKLNNVDLQNLKNAVDEAQAAYDNKKASLETEADSALTEAKANVDKIQSELTAKRTKEIDSKGVADNAKSLYDSLGLEQKGLSFENFNFMFEGYNKLEDKGNGQVEIVDAKNHTCYVVNLSTKEFIGKFPVATGSNNTNDLDKANQDGSHATPGGWLKVEGTHYGRKYNGNAMTLVGQEYCNGNTQRRSVIAHPISYSIGNTTWGCLGFRESADKIKKTIMKDGSMVFVIKEGMINDNSKYKKQSKYYTI